ncbi:hypothetical protein [Pseudoalteromonas sp. S558]|uniref:hypothetical protein n=1 Tax=Pseudoalteromonas sp. S558 TaxID=2066515 RepID=UPI00110AB167|nr:hypothetical protein [Pseudoalteromonas sp. S558]TMO04190.1 hypothetical protein CWB66_09130 [Pseudoalteromonas sp. S558]
MKLFKKALLATAVFGAMGAQAATINNDKFQLSAEGVALEVPAVASDVYFDIKVLKDHASGSFITLTFDDNVDITAIEAAADGSVTQVVSSGESQSGDVYFDYGTGSFTFDDVTVTQADKTKGIPASISFNVNLGNPLTANSAFRLRLADDTTSTTPLAKILGASTLQYKSTVSKTDATVIETGSAVISEEVSQFSFAVGTELDGLIKRDKATKFVGVNDTDVDTDTLVYTFTNDESLGLALRNVDAIIRFDGNFKGVTEAAVLGTNTADALTVTQSAASTDDIAVVSSTGATPTAIAVTDEYTYGDTAAVTPAAVGVKETYTETFIFSNDGDSTTSIPVTGDVEASVVITSASTLQTGGSAVSVGANGYTVTSKVPAGEWEVDATIINIPYLPINATNTSTFIHFANETDKEVDVIVTAIDNRGNEYGPMNLGYKLPANTVKKFSQTDMDTFFSLNGVSTKLSVTFNVDADKHEVSAYAVSQNDKGRTEVSTSQQRGN